MPVAVELPFYNARPDAPSVRVVCFVCGRTYAASASKAATPRCPHCAAVRASVAVAPEVGVLSRI